MQNALGIGFWTGLLLAVTGGTWLISPAYGQTLATPPEAAAPEQPAEAPEVPRRQRPAQTDLDLFTAATGLLEGEGRRVEAAGQTLRMVVDDEDFPQRGSWTWPEQEAAFAFDELLPSWNVTTPPDTGMRFSGRVRDAESGEWSPWLDFGYWGRVPPPRETEAFDGGVVDIDVLVLTRPADAYQMRMSTYSYRLDEQAPSIRQLAVALSSKTAPTTQPTTQPVRWSGVLEVPFTAQATGGPRIGGEICSPTSTTMVMAYFGAERDLLENASAIFDTEHGLFGNWNRAVARAGELGLRSHLQRFSSLDEARQVIANGTPLIISIRFREGEAPSFVIRRTAGHLLVLRGVTPEGDFIVNDPASAERGEGAVYKADDVTRAWLNAGGVGYVITGPAEPTTRPAA